MAAETPAVDRSQSTLAEEETDSKYSLAKERSSASPGLQSGYSEHDHLSAPQFVDKYGCSQLPEAVPPGAHGFPQPSSGFGGFQDLRNDQNHQASLIRRRKKKRILLICAVIFLVLLAAAAGALGGYFGSRRSSDNKTKTPGTTSAPTTQPSSPDTPESNGNNTDGSSGSTSSASIPTDALNGTAMATVAYDAAQKYSADTTAENYLLFYQHSNGDIRKLVYNQSEWHSSELVTNDARLGTGLSVVQFGPVPTVIYVYYIDNEGYLQELRGTHGSNDWTPGTLGEGRFKAVDTYSALSANYIGRCTDRGQIRGEIGWVYYESEEGIQEALWEHDKDRWSKGNLFPDHAPGSEFWSTHDTSPIEAWRMYSLTKDRHVQEYYCLDCCKNATNEWTPGLSATTVDNATLGLAGTMVNGSRIVYYQNLDQYIMELNNTDFPAGSNGKHTEAWVTNPSTKGSGDTEVNVGGSALTTSGIRTKVQAMLGSKLSMAQGFRGLTRQLHLFYQTSGSDITWTMRDEYDIGNWKDPTALNVGV